MRQDVRATRAGSDSIHPKGILKHVVFYSFCINFINILKLSYGEFWETLGLLFFFHEGLSIFINLCSWLLFAFARAAMTNATGWVTYTRGNFKKIVFICV